MVALLVYCTSFYLALISTISLSDLKSFLSYTYVVLVIPTFLLAFSTERLELMRVLDPYFELSSNFLSPKNFVGVFEILFEVVFRYISFILK